jgi:hypothetical protein
MLAPRYAHGPTVVFRYATARADEIERVTGWHLAAEGLCHDDRCVPFATRDTGAIPLADVAAALGAPLVHDDRHGLWALGPEAGGHALVSATAPDLDLPDARGAPFRLSSLRRRKVVLVAWASW